MTTYFSGGMISGELNPANGEFTVTEIKNLHTQSVWNENQLREMHELLTKVRNSGQESLVISTGMLPVLINRSEIEQLHHELESILGSL